MGHDMDGRRKVPTVTHRGRVFRLPFAGLFRPLTPAEDVELRTSIACIGVCHAVKVYDSPAWGPDCVIDGANRLRAAAELGLDLAVEKVEADDDEARRMAEDLNIARRQVTAAEAREARARRVERVAESRAEGKSLRAIAAEEGVSPEQVRQDVKEATVKGLTVEPERVTGLDGKSRPATRPESEEDRLAVEQARADAVEAQREEELSRELEEEDAPPPMTNSLPQPSLDAARKRRPKWMKAGNNVDPDHPFYNLLVACSTLAAAVTKVIATPEGTVLREYLTPLAKHPFKFPHVLFSSGVIDGDVKKPSRAKYVGLHPLRGLIKLAGSGTKLKPADVVKAFAELCGASPEQILAIEADETEGAA